MFDNPRFRILAIVSAVAVAILLIVPATRWLLLFQVQSLFTPPRSIAILLHDRGVEGSPAQYYAELLGRK